MIVSTMLGWKPLIPAALIVLISLAAALAFESVYDVSVQDRRPDSFLWKSPGATPVEPGPLALRLVDSGGVGIPFDDHWGGDYSHDRRTFREVIRATPPYTDAVAFHRVEADWRLYANA